MGLKAAVQALKKAEELKARVSRHSDFLNNSEVWSDQQQLQTVYHQVLVLDLEYALDKKVEQELWTLGFKNHIAALQHLSRDKKNPRRSECQALLSWCLEAASGFYLTLLQELCSAFELDVPFRRRGAVYGHTKCLTQTEHLTQPHKTSCLYICQYCLVHLGDIARYRGQRKQAETFYRHAILLSPSSGQPYNQLALLEATRGDKLATVFHYVRSIAVKHPFPAAATNLSNTLSALIDHDEPLTELHSKLTLTEFLSMFLRVHGLLHLASDLDQAELCVKSLNATFTALVATQAFSSGKLIQMTAINLYAFHHTVDTFSVNQLSTDELRVKNLVLDLVAGAFSAYLLPIYTMNDDVTLLEYYALPAIKLILDWLKTEPKVLSEDVFTKRLQIWPSLCKLLNAVQTHLGEFDTKTLEKVPLPEDRDLQCFLPLESAFKDLDFTTENLNQQDAIFYNKLRITRLVNLGVWLSTQLVDNNVLINIKKVKNPTKVIFEPATKLPDPTTELLEELKHFNIKETADTSKDVSKKPPTKGMEKRGGILKPQGSLEKAREEREQQHQALLLSSETCDSSTNASLSNSSVSSTKSDSSKSKRNRQNVAMQAIAKKVEENNKQVTFLTEPVIKTKDKLTKPPDNIKGVAEPCIVKEIDSSGLNGPIPPTQLASGVHFQLVSGVQGSGNNLGVNQMKLNTNLNNFGPGNCEVGFPALQGLNPPVKLTNPLNGSQMHLGAPFKSGSEGGPLSEMNLLGPQISLNSGVLLTQNFKGGNKIESVPNVETECSRVQAQIPFSMQLASNQVPISQLGSNFKSGVGESSGLSGQLALNGAPIQLNSGIPLPPPNMPLQSNQMPVGSNPVDLPPKPSFPAAQNNVLHLPFHQQQFPYQNSFPPAALQHSNLPSSALQQHSLPLPYPVSTTASSIPFPRQQSSSSAPFNPPVATSSFAGFSGQNQPISHGLQGLQGLQGQPGKMPQLPQGAAPPKDQFSWLRDDKLPLPPSNWWNNNQKNLPHSFSNSTSQEFNSPSFNYNNLGLLSNTGVGFRQDGLKSANFEYNRPFSNMGGNSNLSVGNNNLGIGNSGMLSNVGNNAVYNNMSMWNSGLNMQNNLQMLLNQSGQRMNTQQGQHSFNEGNKIQGLSRENTLNNHENSGVESPSTPGYSLFNSSWAPLSVPSALSTPQDRSTDSRLSEERAEYPERAPLLRQQSLFSGPGPSPLERLLEQQKQLRGSKEDT